MPQNPTPRKLSPDQDKEIAFHHALGMTISDLSRLYGVSRWTISSALKREELETIRHPYTKPGKRVLSPGEEREAIEAYRAGMTDKEIAEVFGVSRVTIGDIRKRHGVPTRPKRKLSDKDDQAIKAAYESGASISSLAHAYAVAELAIRGSLDRTRTKRRPPGSGATKGVLRVHRHAIQPEDVPYLARLYREGARSKELGEMFGVHPRTIRQTLIRYGHELRPRGAFDPEEHLITGLEPQLVEDYLEGMTEEQLVQKYAVTPREVREAIDRHLAAPMRKAPNPDALNSVLIVAGWGALALLGWALLRRRP
jgi:transposase